MRSFIISWSVIFMVCAATSVSAQAPPLIFDRISVEQAEAMIREGSISRGMVPKLVESFEALRQGVAAVHVIGRLGPGDLERAVSQPGSVGTVLVP